MEETAQSKELTIIDKSLNIFRGGSAIILANRSRADKAVAVGKNILVEWDKAYSIQDPAKKKEALAAIDKRSNDFLANCGKAKTEMADARAAITQLMDEIKGMFTAEENRIDPKKSPEATIIQNNRNRYAKDVLQWQEDERKAAEAKAAKAKEEAEIRAYIKNTIAQKLIDHLANQKRKIVDAFNAIVLTNFDDKSEGLRNLVCQFPVSKVGEVIKYDLPAYHRHDFTGVNSIQIDEHGKYPFTEFYVRYEQQLTELKQSLIDKLPSKKEELLEQKRIADKAEEERQAELKRQQEAEAERQKKIAEANAAEKKRLEEQAAKDRAAEAEKLQKMEAEAEQQRIAAEVAQKQREAEEQQRLYEEAAAARKQAEEAAELSKAAGTAMALFEQETAVVDNAPEARTGAEIIVLNPAGWVEIFTFWFQKEGIKLSVEEIGSKKLEQMKKFVEKVANKSGEKIESKNLRYETGVKAVNRKAK